MPKIQVSHIYNKIQEAFDKGYRVVSEQGSARSAKTVSTVIWLITRCLQYPNTTVAIVRGTRPALAGTVYRDFEWIMQEMGVWDRDCMNKTEFIYRFPNGSWLEFFPATDDQRLRGRKRQILYVNEANEISYEEWTQLILRTTVFSIIDYNPSFGDEHWIVQKINDSPRTCFFISTYKDNPFLEQAVVDEIESLKDTSPNLWRVYGLGLRAIIEGRVFKEYKVVEQLPYEANRHCFLGMDFGYTCFSGDTLITTHRGDIPIKDVVQGDYVLTRSGYHRVRNKICNGRKKVVERRITTEMGVTTFLATDEHNFNANGKWKKYGELTKGDMLCFLSPLMGKSTEDTLMGNIPTITITSGKRTGFTTARCCIMPFMNFIKDLFRKVRLYIILTAIPLITISTTLLLYLRENMHRYTRYCRIIAKQRKGQFTESQSNSRKKIGIDVEKLWKTTYRKKCVSVKTVARNLLRQIHIRNFARASAITSGNTLPKNAESKWFANTVEKNLWGINTQNQNAAQTNAHTNYCGIKEIEKLGEQFCEVYDLEVEGVHEYFANGILVHNCDPSTLVYVSIVGKKIYMKELCYRTEMSTTDLINRCKEVNREYKRSFKIWADSAEPREIAEIHNAGIDIHPVRKFAGSIIAGINKMLEYQLIITADSLNLKKELNNYVYRQDKDGKWLNEPIDAFNHLIDPVRYIILSEVLGNNGNGLDAQEAADILF